MNSVILYIIVGIILLLIASKIFQSQRKKIPYRTRKILEHSLDIEMDKGTEESFTLRAKEREKLKDYKGALEDYDKVLKNFSPDYEIFFRRAIAKSKLNDFNGAISDFTSAINLNMEEPSAYYARGLCYSHLKLYNEAISDYSKAIERGIKEIIIFYHRAKACIELNLYVEAKNDLNIYLNHKPDSSETNYYIGFCDYNLGNYQDSLIRLNKCIELNPSHEAAYFYRALSKRELNDLDGCCKDLDIALKKGHLLAYHYIKQYCKEQKT